MDICSVTGYRVELQLVNLPGSTKGQYAVSNLSDQYVNRALERRTSQVCECQSIGKAILHTIRAVQDLHDAAIS